MKNQLKRIVISMVVFAAVLSMALPASAGVRFRGGIFVGPAVRPWGWYRPFYRPYYYGYGPYYGPYAYSMAYRNAGQVKLDTKVKDAEVFINGAYAGTAGKLKSMWLRPDTYDLEIRAPGRVPYAERIYVIAGKTLKVQVDLPFESRP